jgi:serine/threonine-protein kinase
VIDLGERYRAEAVLGSGAFGRVYRATDTRLGRPVAIKEVPAARGDAEIASRLQREAKIATQVRHPNLVDLMDVGTTPDGIPFLVFELVPGRNLDEVLEEGVQPPERVVAWVAQLADALDVLHRAGVVHRDVKPANVLVHEDGRALLADLGMVSGAADQTALTATGALVGTPLYMPPEVLRGEGDPGPAGDLYALGALAYRALYDEDWRDVEEVQRLLTRGSARDEGISSERLGRFPDHDPWLRGLLDVDPERRLGPASRVAARLRGEDTSEPAPPAGPGPARASRRGTRWLFLPLLGLFALGYLATFREPAPAPPQPAEAPEPGHSPRQEVDLRSPGTPLVRKSTSGSSRAASRTSPTSWWTTTRWTRNDARFSTPPSPCA